MELMKQQYRESLEYLRERLRRPFLFCLAAFLAVGLLCGLIFSLNPDLTYQIVAQITAMIADKNIIGSDGGLAMGRLLWSNLVAGLLGILYGIVPFLFLPVFSILLNASILGALGALYYLSGIGFGILALGILPHGIFEIPALLLCVAMGIQLCLTLTRMILGRYGALEFQVTVYGTLQVFFLWVLPLFTLAAVIECTLTPWLLGLVP